MLGLSSHPFVVDAPNDAWGSEAGEYANQVATASDVAARLAALGAEITHTPEGGIVGLLKRGAGPAFGLCAELAADRAEILLQAARRLSEHPGVTRSLYFIFHSTDAEMRFDPCAVDAARPIVKLFALRDDPRLGAGMFALRAGAVCPSESHFDIVVRNPDDARREVDAMSAAAEIARAIHAIVATRLGPTDLAHVAVSEIRACQTGEAFPTAVRIGGYARSLEPMTQTKIETAISSAVHGVCLVHGLRGSLTMRMTRAATRNDQGAVRAASRAATLVAGRQCVVLDLPPALAPDAFGSLAERIPGALIFVGSNRGPERSQPGRRSGCAAALLGEAFWIALAGLSRADGRAEETPARGC